MINFLKSEFEFDNDKGRLVQLVHDGWKQVNVICSKAKSVRGNHYHLYNQEAFYIIYGSFTLILWENENKEIYEIKEGDFFSINPGVFHTFKYHEDTLLISLYSNGVELEGNVKDIWNV